MMVAQDGKHMSPAKLRGGGDGKKAGKTASVPMRIGDKTARGTKTGSLRCGRVGGPRVSVPGPAEKMPAVQVQGGEAAAVKPPTILSGVMLQRLRGIGNQSEIDPDLAHTAGHAAVIDPQLAPHAQPPTREVETVDIAIVVAAERRHPTSGPVPGASRGQVTSVSPWMRKLGRRTAKETKRNALTGVGTVAGTTASNGMANRGKTKGGVGKACLALMDGKI